MKKIVFFVLIVTTMNLVNAQPASFKSPPEWSKAANIYEVNIRQYTLKEPLMHLQNIFQD